ncbi:MAG: sugar kinase [Devosiaceae bacterium]|nr:sugar kinase [Devosiaceae bacterium]
MDSFSLPEKIDRPIKIACVGEAMIELSFAGDNLDQPNIAFAGDTLNTAIYLKREIKNSAEISFVSRLGTDEFSTSMLAFMNKEGLNTNNITRDANKLPGLYSIMTDEHGERTFNYWRQNSAAKELFQTGGEIDFSPLSDFDIIYYSAISLAILPVNVREAFLGWLADQRSLGNIRVAFDSNYRPALWSGVEDARFWTEKAWKNCDIALPSADDEKSLFGDRDIEQTIKRLNSYGANFGALKRGADGPLPLTPIGELPQFKPAKKIIDTTAAGDSFNGAFLGALLVGAPIKEAMLKGHDCARETVGFAGAFAN